MNKIKINDRFSVGGQPTKEELQTLKDEGYKSIINLREDNETDQPISTEVEGKIAKELGLEYLNVPCNAKSMKNEQFDKIRKAFETMPKPIYVHCRSSLRAGACVMSQLAIENGISGEGALMFADRMGFKCDIPELREFTKDYINLNTNSI